MDKLTRLVSYLRRCKGDEPEQRISVRVSSSSSSCRDGETSPAEENPRFGDDTLERDFHASTKFFTILEGILLWENTVNSISVLLLFHIIFWGIVVFEIRGFAAASSAALFAVLGYSTLESQIQKETKTSKTPVSPRKVERIDKIVKKAKCTLESLKLLRKNQPGVFCAGVCTFSIVLWLIGNSINGILLTYAICMAILIGPALLLRVPCKIFSPKELCREYLVEWDNEIEEFLPAVTDDNLEVLQRAGDTGEHSSTPQGASLENQIDPLNDEELAGLKMPSHEEGSTDGLDVSELELSSGDNDADSIKMQSEHFEPGSSSDDDVDLEPVSRKLPSHSEEESDSEFEIIDSREIAHLDDV